MTDLMMYATDAGFDAALARASAAQAEELRQAVAAVKGADESAQAARDADLAWRWSLGG